MEATDPTRTEINPWEMVEQEIPANSTCESLQKSHEELVASLSVERLFDTLEPCPVPAKLRTVAVGRTSTLAVSARQMRNLLALAKPEYWATDRSRPEQIVRSCVNRLEELERVHTQLRAANLPPDDVRFMIMQMAYSAFHSVADCAQALDELLKK